MNNVSETNIFITSDLSLATVLSLFFPLDGIEKKDPHKAQFLFIRQKELDQIIESYWRKELKIEPQLLFSQLKFIKTRLYSQ